MKQQNLLCILLSLSILLILCTISPTHGQDYAEYARGAGMARRRNNRGPVAMAAATGIFGGLVGSWFASNRLSKKHDKEKKDLLQYIKLQDEIYKERDKQWQIEYRKLYAMYDELEKESVERDYEEFKAPDTNNDDMISRTEFNTYVRKYLSSFPELSEKDFPKFEEFDLDKDGNVSFEEWQQFLYQQKLLEQQKAKAGSSNKGGTNSAYNELLNALYEQSHSSDSFNSLNKQISAGSKGAATKGGAVGGGRRGV